MADGQNRHPGQPTWASPVDVRAGLSLLAFDRSAGKSRRTAGGALYMPLFMDVRTVAHWLVADEIYLVQEGA